MGLKNIFISSTYIDCKNYRKAAVDAINSLQSEDLNVLGMELFGARKKTTLEVCLEEVSKADIYILIVAHRYGTIDESTQKSYTQLEYEKIVKKDITILVYFLDESVPVMPCWVDKDFKYTKLSEFKSELGKRHTLQTFLDADDLRHKIVSDLSRELNLDYKTVKYHIYLVLKSEVVVENEMQYGTLFYPSQKLINNLIIHSMKYFLFLFL